MANKKANTKKPKQQNQQKQQKQAGRKGGSAEVNEFSPSQMEERPRKRR